MKRERQCISVDRTNMEWMLPALRGILRKVNSLTEEEEKKSTSPSSNL